VLETCKHIGACVTNCVKHFDCQRVRNVRSSFSKECFTSHGSIDNAGCVRRLVKVLRSVHCMRRHAFIEEGRRRHFKIRGMRGQLSIMAVRSAMALLVVQKERREQRWEVCECRREAETGRDEGDTGGMREQW
jgi:hypothetical protein